ncbi:MAG TPA: MFS transporter [Candidatus Obscuribacterales bacterium]
MLKVCLALSRNAARLESRVRMVNMRKIPFGDFRSLPVRIISELRQTFRSLSNRNYRVYSTGQLVSNAGTWMQSVALSWLVYKLTDSAVALGLVSFASYVPLLLLTYVGGIAADRFDRRKILMWTQGLAGAQALVLALLTATGTLSVALVIALALFLGCVTAIGLPARQAFLADLIDEKEMVNAVGVNSAIFNTSRLSGPLLAGVVIGAFGEATCFALNAVGFLFSLFMLARVRIAGSGKAKEKETDEVASERNLHIRTALKNPTVRGILALAGITSMFGFMYGVLLPVIVGQLLKGEAGQLGLLAAAGGIGALFGSLGLASRGKTELLAKGIGFGCLGLAVAVTVIAFSHSVLISFAAAAGAGFCVSIQFSGGNSLLQTIVPPEVRGRMMGIFSTFQLGFTPFGALLAGWMAQHLGLTPALLVSATVCGVAAALYLLRRPKVTTD